MSHYATLGIKEDATSAEVKKAFRKLAAEHHPDKGGNEEKFKQINEAYHTLKEDSTRQQYDAQRRMGANPFANGPFRQHRTPHGFSFSFSDDGMNAGGFADGSFPDDIGEIFRHMTGRSPRGQSYNQEKRNKDIRVNLRVGLQEIMNNQSKTLSVRKSSGENETLYVTIPRTTRTGTRIRYPGLGDDMFTSLPRGDLYVEITIDNTDKFTYNSDDLYTKIEIDAFDAMTGGHTDIDGIDGKKFTLTIPAGTQPGTKMRIPNQGLYKSNNNDERGHLLLTIDVKIPKVYEKFTDQIAELKENIMREKNK